MSIKIITAGLLAGACSFFSSFSNAAIVEVEWTATRQGGDIVPMLFGNTATGKFTYDTDAFIFQRTPTFFEFSNAATAEFSTIGTMGELTIIGSSLDFVIRTDPTESTISLFQIFNDQNVSTYTVSENASIGSSSETILGFRFAPIFGANAANFSSDDLRTNFFEDFSKFGIGTVVSASTRNADGTPANGGNYTITSLSSTPLSSPVPLPGAAWLFGSALLGLVGFRRGVA